MQTGEYASVGAPALNEQYVPSLSQPCVPDTPWGMSQIQEMSFGAPPQIPPVVLATTSWPGKTMWLATDNPWHRDSMGKPLGSGPKLPVDVLAAAATGAVRANMATVNAAVSTAPTGLQLTRQQWGSTTRSAQWAKARPARARSGPGETLWAWCG